MLRQEKNKNDSQKNPSWKIGLFWFGAYVLFFTPLFLSITILNNALTLNLKPEDVQSNHLALPLLAGLIVSLILSRKKWKATKESPVSIMVDFFPFPGQGKPTLSILIFYLKYISLTALFIGPFALIQQLYILDINISDINFNKFFIPLSLAIFLGYFIANQGRLKNLLHTKIDLLANRDREFKILNETLEQLAQSRANELIRERKMSRIVLDFQPNIVILSDGYTIQDANFSFFQAFAQTGTIEDFQLKYGCISHFFDSIPGNQARSRSDSWIAWVADHPDESFFVKTNVENMKRDYSIQARKLEMESDRPLYVVTLTDVTQLIEIKEKLKTRLYINALTGLPNRIRLNRDAVPGEQGLILINVDGFQEVNNFFGHKIGDQILIDLSQILQTKLKELHFNLQVYHVGGDEFALLLPANMSEDTIRFLGNAIHDSLNLTIPVSSSSLATALSLTISVVLPGASLPPEMGLLNAADLSLKEARKKRLGVYIIKNIEEKYSEYETNLKRARILKNAVSRGGIVSVYQPILHLKSGTIRKYESLARILRKDGSMIAPSEFLQVAQTTRMYHHITRSIFDHACDVFQNRSEKFSVNLTMDDINTPETLLHIKEALASKKLGSRFIVEIVESQNIDNFDNLNEVIRDLKNMGVEIAIDDFGSGFSNFEYLLKMKVDYLKIDSSLIRNIDEDDSAKLIVASILDFARSMGILTIAEFVHSKSVMDTVREMGFDYAQGYYIGEPGPLDRFRVVHNDDLFGKEE